MSDPQLRCPACGGTVIVCVSYEEIDLYCDDCALAGFSLEELAQAAYERGRREANDADPETRIRQLVESHWWPPTLQPMHRYAREHDDHDGDRGQLLAVVFTRDGDACVETTTSCRFRTGIGGGVSLRTRRALMILALAIKWDSEEAPDHA